MVTAEPVIAVRNLSKRFGRVTAVGGVSFAVPPGSVTGFLGPNGAGKTTTLRMILGLAVPTGGEARVYGVAYRDLEQPLARVGAALETTGFHPGRTARSHLRVACMQGRIDQSRVDAVLALTGMTQFADTRVGGFSLGMKQRLAFATALVGQPTALILDEPANGLDPAGVAWLRGFLRRFVDDGGAVLVSSHLLTEVAEVADRVVVIDRGLIVAEDTVERLVATGGERVIVRSPDAAGLATGIRGAGGTVTDRPDGTLEVADVSAERVGELAAAGGVVLHELRTERSTLEDAFLTLTEGHAIGAKPAPSRPDQEGS